MCTATSADTKRQLRERSTRAACGGVCQNGWLAKPRVSGLPPKTAQPRGSPGLARGAGRRPPGSVSTAARILTRKRPGTQVPTLGQFSRALCANHWGLPAPRRLRRRPYVQWQAPLVWTTLSLTLHTDGRAEGALAGASRFPRHWVYDGNGQLSHKSGLTDFGDWYRSSFGRHSPWGDEDSPALVTAVETALERSLSVQLMGGSANPRNRQIKAGEVLVRQGERLTSIYLVLDGVIRVDRDGERLAE